MGARAGRPWYKKKTNWAVIATVLSSGLAAFPPTQPFGIVLLGMSRAFAGYATSDRAGKPNENITNQKRTVKAKTIVNNTVMNNTTDTATDSLPVNVNITEE